jgi:hypothetical protein
LELRPDGDIDLGRATRLTVLDGDFSYLGVREVDVTQP